MPIDQLIFYVGVLFLMMVPGIVLKKCNLVSDGFGKGLSNLVLYIAQPALIVYAYLASESSFAQIWKNALLVLLYSLLAHVLFALVAQLFYRRVPIDRAGMLRFVTVFSNAAFMGIPLIQAILGAEAAIYASIYNVTFNLFLWTLGVHYCTDRAEDLDRDGDTDAIDRLHNLKRQSKKEQSILKVLVHPVTLASVIGILLLACGVKLDTLTTVKLGVLAEALSMLRSLVAPLSMVVIGLRLPEISWRGMHRDVSMWYFLLLRHIALPLGVVLLCKLPLLFGLPVPEVVCAVVVIMAAAPAATSATMFAEKYSSDAVYVSRLVAVSTLICILTMPLILLLL